MGQYNLQYKCMTASSQQILSYLVHLVCGAVLADSDRDGGLVWQGYPQFYICHSIVVLHSNVCGLTRVCACLYECACMGLF